MTPATLLILILLFQVKHLLADFIWQTGWMVRNKGTYGHLGGIAHAGLHGLLTVPVLIWTPMTVLTVVGLAAVEFVLHYHIDWTKDRLLRWSGWSPQEKGYWGLTGLDQFAHQVTYVAIVWLALGIV
ncbi:MAG TPA: DUF3307 domain-containing protein [Roseovarius sp.]|jgi:hypothetical protein|nr:DUF3307 domain-containing protein [Roseovarius sp.]